MAETVTLEDLSTQPAGQPVLVNVGSLAVVHSTGLDTNGVTRERINITAYNCSTVSRVLTLAISGGAAQIVVALRPQAGPVLVASDILMPASTSLTTWQINAQADGADVFLSGLVYQYKDVEL